MGCLGIIKCVFCCKCSSQKLAESDSKTELQDVNKNSHKADSKNCNSNNDVRTDSVCADDEKAQLLPGNTQDQDNTDQADQKQIESGPPALGLNLEKNPKADNPCPENEKDSPFKSCSNEKVCTTNPISGKDSSTSSLNGISGAIDDVTLVDLIADVRRTPEGSETNTPLKGDNEKTSSLVDVIAVDGSVSCGNYAEENKMAAPKVNRDDSNKMQLYQLLNEVGYPPISLECRILKMIL